GAKSGQKLGKLALGKVPLNIVEKSRPRKRKKHQPDVEEDSSPPVVTLRSVPQPRRASAGSVPVRPRPTTREHTPPRRRSRRGLWLAAFTVVTAGAAAAAMFLRKPPPDVPVWRVPAEVTAR